MTAAIQPFSPGDPVEVVSIPVLSGKGKAPWHVGQVVRVERVSENGALVVTGHGGFVKAHHFAAVSR